MSALLHLTAVHLLPASEISEEMTDAQIIEAAGAKVRERHTPGSATLSTSQKPTVSGPVYQSEISWSVPKMLTEADSNRLLETGAILIRTMQWQDILIYRNDVFQNTRLRPSFENTPLRSQITFGITTIKPLF